MFTSQNKHLKYLLISLSLLFFSHAIAAETLVTPDVIHNITHLYNGASKDRMLAWASLIQTRAGNSELEKLKNVNAFFNKLAYRSDAQQVGRVDFWMTPVEFLAKGGGDCEDYAISKYFTLEAVGLPQSKLRIAYVKYLVQGVAHMVLTYYPTPDATPLVLDNLTGKILPADQRTDLNPIYSFNGDGLWQSIQRNQGRSLSGSSNISMWRDLNARMNRQLLGGEKA